MNSEMFMLWVEEKLVPVYQLSSLPINAPYRHTHEIGWLTSVSQEKMVNMMVKHSVRYINLPLTYKQMELSGEDMEDRGNCI
jgi:hypothetical protein